MTGSTNGPTNGPTNEAHLPEDVLLALAGAAGDVGGDHVGVDVAGPVGPAARSHLAGCRTCQEQVAACRAAAAVVGGASVPGRAWCPPREGLLAFAPGLGEPSPTDALRAHVTACPACREDVRDLLALDAAAAPLAGAIVDSIQARVTLVLEQLGEALGRGLRLLDSTLAPLAGPAPALARGDAADLRGGGDAVAVAAPFGAGELEVTWVVGAVGVDLRARARGGAPCAYRLDLSVPGPGPSGSEGGAGAGAAEGGWALLESRSADEGGDVTLAGLSPGRYLLSLFGPQRRGPDLNLELELRT